MVYASSWRQVSFWGRAKVGRPHWKICRRCLTSDTDAFWYGENLVRLTVSYSDIGPDIKELSLFKYTLSQYPHHHLHCKVFSRIAVDFENHFWIYTHRFVIWKSFFESLKYWILGKNFVYWPPYKVLSRKFEIRYQAHPISSMTALGVERHRKMNSQARKLYSRL